MDVKEQVNFLLEAIKNRACLNPALLIEPLKAMTQAFEKLPEDKLLKAIKKFGK